MEKLSDQTEMPLINTRVTSTTMEVVKVFKGNLRVGEKMVFGQGNSIRCTWVFHEDALGSEYLFYLTSYPRMRSFGMSSDIDGPIRWKMRTRIFFISTS